MAKSKKADLPPLPENSTGIPPNNRYREQYGVVVVCPNEDAQKAVYEGLRAVAGAKFMVVVT
ncbi:MAG: hypothetical protein JJ902_01300 [Roseibium sp.]|nr:hypothetical protein [Roseibium sp.]